MLMHVKCQVEAAERAKVAERVGGDTGVQNAQV